MAHPHQLNTFTIEGRDRLGNTRSDTSAKPDGTTDEFIVGIIGPAIVEGGTIEMEMDDGYTSWRGGVIDNNNGTYTVNYRVDAQKAINTMTPLEIYIKIDDGTMFNSETLDRYEVWGQELHDEYMESPAFYQDQEQQYDEHDNPIEQTEADYEEQERDVRFSFVFFFNTLLLPK